MWQDDRIQAALDGQNPMVMAELPGGFAVFGDVQFLPGYSVLLPTLGDAILTACEPLRVNYDILGNTDHFLHAHVFPRYQSEVPERLAKPVWLYAPSYWRDPQYQYEPSQHDAIRQRITAALKTTN